MAVTGKNIGVGGNYSGEYIPTITDVTGTSSSSVSEFEYRVDGNKVYVSGIVITTVISGQIEFYLSLPIPINITAQSKVKGYGASRVSNVINCFGGASLDNVRLVGTVTASTGDNYNVNFEYSL